MGLLKHKYLSSFIILTLCFGDVSAVELTQEEWEALSGQQRYVSLTELEKSGADLKDPKNILLASKIIASLIEKNKLTAKEIHQLNKWRRVDSQLSVVSATNPRDSELKIDIGKEAKSALQVIRARAAADELYQKWQDNQFQKSDLLTLKGASKSATFSNFFNRLSPVLQTGFADWAMEQLIELGSSSSGDYNHMVGHMAKILRDVNIAKFLIEELPPNQFSYLFLQAMPDTYQEAEFLELLKVAAGQPKLRTQSFNLLAQHFASDSEVAVIIANTLKDKDAYWQALTVMPAFVSAGNSEAFENIVKTLPKSQQAQVNMRLQRK